MFSSVFSIALVKGQVASLLSFNELEFELTDDEIMSDDTGVLRAGVVLVVKSLSHLDVSE